MVLHIVTDSQFVWLPREIVRSEIRVIHWFRHKIPIHQSYIYLVVVFYTHRIGLEPLKLLLDKIRTLCILSINFLIFCFWTGNFGCRSRKRWANAHLLMVGSPSRLQRKISFAQSVIMKREAGSPMLSRRTRYWQISNSWRSCSLLLPVSLRSLMGGHSIPFGLKALYW